MAPKLGERRREHAERLSTAVLTRGGADANRTKATDHGIEPMLVQENREVAELYDAVATPSAVAVDANGRIASPVASGEAAIAALVARFAKPAVEVFSPARSPRRASRCPASPAPWPISTVTLLDSWIASAARSACCSSGIRAVASAGECSPTLCPGSATQTPPPSSS